MASTLIESITAFRNPAAKMAIQPHSLALVDFSVSPVIQPPAPFDTISLHLWVDHDCFDYLFCRTITALPSLIWGASRADWMTSATYTLPWSAQSVYQTTRRYHNSDNVIFVFDDLFHMNVLKLSLLCRSPRKLLCFVSWMKWLLLSWLRPL